jgi:hypothetical protein
MVAASIAILGWIGFGRQLVGRLMPRSRNRVSCDVAMFAMSSSSIAAAGYDRERHALRLRYVSGGTYDYLDVPSSVFQAFLGAPSKGQFVNWYIKPGYRFTRLN